MYIFFIAIDNILYFNGIFKSAITSTLVPESVALNVAFIVESLKGPEIICEDKTLLFFILKLFL